MVKKMILVAVLIACVVPVAQADMFTQQTTFTGSHGKFIYEYSPYYTYAHDLLSATPPVDVAAGDVVASATLTLDLYDDEQVYLGSKPPVYLEVSLDGQAWIDFGQVLTGSTQSLALNVPSAYLNDNGQLSVQVHVYDYTTGYPTADLYLTRSTLSGETAVVPLPGAVLLGILGLGGAGLKLRKQA